MIYVKLRIHIDYTTGETKQDASIVQNFTGKILQLCFCTMGAQTLIWKFNQTEQNKVKTFEKCDSMFYHCIILPITIKNHKRI